MYYLILLLLISSIPAQAQPLWQKILNGEMNTSIDAMTCTDEFALQKQCINNLCSKYDAANEYPMAITTDNVENFITKTNVTIPHEELQLMEKYFDSNLKIIQEQLKEAQNKSADEMLEEVSNGFIRSYGESIILSSCVIQIIPEKLNIDCNENIPASIVNHYQKNAEKELSSNYYEALVSGFYSEKYFRENLSKLKEKHEEEFKNLQKELRKIEQEDPDHYSRSYDKKLLVEQILKDGWETKEFNHQDLTQFVQALGQLHSSSIDTEDACSTKECMDFAANTFKENYSAKIQEAIKKVNDPLFKHQTIAALRADYVLDKSNPTYKEAEEFKIHKDEVVKKVLHKAKNFMSEHSYSEYSKQLTNLEIEYDGDGYYKPYYTETPMKPSARDFITNVMKGKVANLFHTSSLPKYLISDHYYDYTMSGLDDFKDAMAVKFSLFSFRNPKIGKQILAHELGHHLSHIHEYGMLSPKTSEDITKTKSCLHERHSSLSHRGNINPGLFYEEEEFADEFGFTVFEDNHEKIFCPILLDYTKAENLNMLNSQDTHLPTLWRTINQSLYNGEIPSASCQELINQHSNKYQFKKCL